MTSADINRIIKERLNQFGESQIDTFEYGVFRDMPNTRGMFQLKGKWFIYEIDEKNVIMTILQNILFNDDDIVYACAKMLHKAKYFEDHRFGKEAKSTYIHAHYRSLREAEESL